MSLITASACNDDFLERYPLDQISDVQFWNSATDLELYANQFYADLRAPHYNWRDDDISDNNAPGNRHPFSWNEYVLPATGGGWDKSDWLPIRRTNYALARIADMAKIELKEETLEFLDAVNTFNISTRYPDEKFKFYKLCTVEFTENYFNQIKEIYKCLLQKITH